MPSLSANDLTLDARSSSRGGKEIHLSLGLASLYMDQLLGDLFNLFELLQLDGGVGAGDAQCCRDAVLTDVQGCIVAIQVFAVLSKVKNYSLPHGERSGHGERIALEPINTIELRVYFEGNSFSRPNDSNRKGRGSLPVQQGRGDR